MADTHWLFFWIQTIRHSTFTSYLQGTLHAMLVKTVWKRSARSWIVEKKRKRQIRYVQTSPGALLVPSANSPASLLPSSTITVGPVHVQLRKFALASISAANVGSRASRRANNGNVCPLQEKEKWKRYFEVDTRRRCLCVSFWCLFRSLHLLITRNRYRNPTIGKESGCSVILR